jgi:L-rhamnose mutarotase
MPDETEQEYQAWHEDIEYLVKILKECFESTDSSYYVDEINNILYVELEGLGDYSEDEIVEIAGPVLEELDLDFEDIMLLPLS